MASSFNSPTQTQVGRLLAGPAATPPPHVHPDFGGTSSAIRLCIYVQIPAVFTVVSLALLLRLFARIYLMRSIVPEDYLIMCAWIGEIALFTTSILQFRMGIYNHMWNISEDTVIRGIHQVAISIIIYPITTMLVKVSILLQYLRIFVPIRRMNPALFNVYWVCIVVTVVFSLVTDIGVALRSTHNLSEVPAGEIAQAVSFSSGGYTFVSPEKPWIIASSIFNLISDVIILLLPVPCLMKLKVNAKRKAAISGLFAAGILAWVVSALRLRYTLLLFESNDISWYSVVLILLSWNDTALGILIFCLPSLPQVFNYLRSKGRIRQQFGFRGLPFVSNEMEAE